MLRSTAHRLPWLAVPILAGALQACDPISSPDPELIVDARVDAGHIHSFETDVTFTVSVTEAGTVNAVEDFTVLRVELSRFETETWTKQVPLQFDGTAYVGTTKFTANGAFDVRVVGQRPGQTSPIEIHRYDTPLSAVRFHVDAGGYRVEFETDTGEYPVQGEPVTFRYLIMEDVTAPRPPITGLAGVTIHCSQGTDIAVHAATESPAGTYSASHVFNALGEASARIEFTGSDQNPASVEVPLSVF